jgi:quercetin dioxygenase-like cupin family protein
MPALFAAQAAAKGASDAGMPSKCYQFENLPKKTDPETHTEQWQVFHGQTHDGYKLACHITRLQPGHISHPPHQHVNEEILFMHEGTVEVTIAGVANRIGPGSVAYIHSNEMHGTRNVGDTPAQYFILELDGLAKE